MPALKKKSGINLIIKEQIQENISGQFLNWALTYGRYIIIIIQIVVLSVFFMRFKLDRDHTDLKESVSQKQALILSISELETEIRRLQKKIADIRVITTDQDAVLRIITFLEENTPNDTIYSILSFSSNNLKFIATAPNLKSFNFLLRKLQDNEMLSDVMLEDLQRQPDGTVQFRVQTKINLN